MFGRVGALPAVGSAAQLASTRPRLSRPKATTQPVTDSPQYPARRRARADARPAHERAAAHPAHERAAARDGRGRDDDRAAARIERLAQQSWVEGAEPELPVRTIRPERAVFHLGLADGRLTPRTLTAAARRLS